MERALAKVKHHSKEVSCLRTWQKKRPSKCECQCECDITNISKNKRARIHTRAVRLQAKFIHVRKCAILSLSLFSAHTFACTHFQKSIFYLKNFLNHKSDLAIYSTFALYYANVFLFVDFDIFRVHEHFGLILLLLLARLFFFSLLFDECYLGETAADFDVSWNVRCLFGASYFDLCDDVDRLENIERMITQYIDVRHKKLSCCFAH